MSNKGTVVEGYEYVPILRITVVLDEPTQIPTSYGIAHNRVVHIEHAGNPVLYEDMPKACKELHDTFAKKMKETSEKDYIALYGDYFITSVLKKNILTFAVNASYRPVLSKACSDEANNGGSMKMNPMRRM